MQSVLVVNEVSLQVRLGCLEEERRSPQLVKVKIKFTFAEGEPRAVTTDALEDTICYARVTEELKKVTAHQEFNLVEHLAGTLLTCIRSCVDEKIRIDLALTKVNPPVNEITGGVTFYYGESR